MKEFFRRLWEDMDDLQGNRAFNWLMVLMVILAMFALSKPVLEAQNRQIELSLREDLDDIFAGALNQFCIEKMGEDSRGSFSPEFTYVYVTCHLNKDGWSRTEIYKKEDFKEWIKTREIVLV